MTEEAILERTAIASHLMRVADAYEKHAHAMLSDTMQNKVVADAEKRIGLVLREQADNIEAGRHWR